MSATSEKYTARNFYNEVIAANISETVTNFAKAEIEKMDARNAKRVEKNAEKAAELQPVLDQIVDEILTTEPKTATEIGAVLGFSAQKVSPMMKKLVEAGRAKVETVKVKGKRPCNGYTVA